MICPHCKGSGEMEGTVGDLVAALRRAKGLTQVELADAAGCTGSMITKIETDQRDPTTALLRMIAAALGVSAKELLP